MKNDADIIAEKRKFFKSQKLTAAGLGGAETALTRGANMI